ncbi:glycosyltransferase family A protein [Microbacterium aurum]|uniref:glycosyltransferase family 2 protein n=1 Tax=Microbacterium aurum TaxID=36805 RepID=UPI0028EA509A|nr:glycosyltransferase family A protein [Microbacterium aurum]
MVVPCYNYGAFLPQSVRSILDQQGLEIRVTIVDDASPDGSAAVADQLAAADPRVSVLHNEVNLGAVRTFNRGIAQVDADYMLLISADDLVAPNALTRAAALMEANPTVGLVYGHAQKFVGEPKPRGAFPFVTWSTWAGHDWIRMQLGRSWSNISSPEAVVRASVQHEVGLYDPSLTHTHDVEMWLRIAAVADVGHINGIDQAYYRRQPQSYSTKFDTYRDIEERWLAYEQFVSRWDASAQTGDLGARVRSNLSQEALSALVSEMEAGLGVEPAHVAEVRDLARRIDPSAPRTALWQDVERIGDETLDIGSSDIGYRARRWRRRTASAVRWQRWRRARYFG